MKVRAGPYGSYDKQEYITKCVAGEKRILKYTYIVAQRPNQHCPTKTSTTFETWPASFCVTWLPSRGRHDGYEKTRTRLNSLGKKSLLRKLQICLRQNNKRQVPNTMLSPPRWWTKTKDLSLAPFVCPPVIVHCSILICISRDWLQTSY